MKIINKYNSKAEVLFLFINGLLIVAPIVSGTLCLFLLYSFAIINIRKRGLVICFNCVAVNVLWLFLVVPLFIT